MKDGGHSDVQGASGANDPTTGVDVQAIRKLGLDIAELIRSRFSADAATQELLFQLLDGIRAGLGQTGEGSAAPGEGAHVLHGVDPQLARVATAKSTKTAGTYGPSNPRAARIVSVSEDPSGGECTVVFDVDGSGLSARTGDRLALCPRNDPEEVRRLLRAFNARGVENVSYGASSGPAWRVLLEEVEIASTSEQLLDFLRLKLATREQLLLVEEFVSANHPSLLALLRRFPNLSLKLSDVLPCMRPLRSTSAQVADLLTPSDGQLRCVLSKSAKARAAMSGISLNAGAWVPLYIDCNSEGYLSDDAELPLVIVTDDFGVHIARSYVAERRRKGHRGRSWILATGTQSHSALLSELSSWQREGLLTRLDVVGQKPDPESQERVVAQDMLWRWFVDRSAIFILGEDDAATTRLDSMVRTMLSGGGRKETRWFDAPIAERRECHLYRTLVLD